MSNNLLKQSHQRGQLGNVDTVCPPSRRGNSGKFGSHVLLEEKMSAGTVTHLSWEFLFAAYWLKFSVIFLKGLFMLKDVQVTGVCVNSSSFSSFFLMKG